MQKYPLIDADIEALAPGNKITRNTALMLNMLNRHRDVLAAKGVLVTPSADLTAWREFITSTGRTAANSLDPALRNDIRADNALWLRAERDGEIIGAIACRAFETESIYKLCQTGRLWHPISKAIKEQPDFVLQDFPDLAGRMIYQGGLRVTAEGEGIGWHLIRMIRWIGYTFFEADIAVGCYLDSDIKGWDPIGFSGYQHVAPVLHDAEIGDKRQDVWLAAVTRNHSLRQIETEAADVTSRHKAASP